MCQSNAVHQSWLESIVTRFGGTAGTVHVQRGTDLVLTAAHNIPDSVIQMVSRIPRGKGMAGLAQVRKVPVQTCDLQSDATGNIRPGAKAVDARAAIALPVLDDSGEVRGVVGIAWSGDEEITQDNERMMLEAAIGLPVLQ